MTRKLTASEREKRRIEGLKKTALKIASEKPIEITNLEWLFVLRHAAGKWHEKLRGKIDDLNGE